MKLSTYSRQESPNGELSIDDPKKLQHLRSLVGAKVLQHLRSLVGAKIFVVAILAATIVGVGSLDRTYVNPSWHKGHTHSTVVVALVLAVVGLAMAALLAYCWFRARLRTVRVHMDGVAGAVELAVVA
ncbi:hypothetical protein vseg_008628 [Gypsophila vaccaria]